MERWREPEGRYRVLSVSEDIFAQLSPVISDEEAKTIRRLPEFQIVNAIQNTIELKIISEMNKLIFGRNLTQMSEEEQKRLTEIAKEFEVENLEQTIERRL